MKIKDRKVGGEAPSVRVKMASGEEKIIGMLAVKIQVFITLDDINSYTKELHEILYGNTKKVFGYMITRSGEDEMSAIIKDYGIDQGLITNQWVEFSKKFGLNATEGVLANSVFVVDKEGVITYKEIADTLDLANFDANLTELINYKPKGHTHENWMSV